jgi:hypothetical protein
MTSEKNMSSHELIQRLLNNKREEPQADTPVNAGSNIDTTKAQMCFKYFWIFTIDQPSLSVTAHLCIEYANSLAQTATDFQNTWSKHQTKAPAVECWRDSDDLADDCQRIYLSTNVTSWIHGVVLMTLFVCTFFCHLLEHTLLYANPCSTV